MPEPLARPGMGKNTGHDIPPPHANFNNESKGVVTTQSGSKLALEPTVSASSALLLSAGPAEEQATVPPRRTPPASLLTSCANETRRHHQRCQRGQMCPLVKTKGHISKAYIRSVLPYLEAPRWWWPASSCSGASSTRRNRSVARAETLSCRIRCSRQPPPPSSFRCRPSSQLLSPSPVQLSRCLPSCQLLLPSPLQWTLRPR